MTRRKPAKKPFEIKPLKPGRPLGCPRKTCHGRVTACYINDAPAYECGLCRTVFRVEEGLLTACYLVSDTE
jgi:hypothetical protein